MGKGGPQDGDRSLPRIAARTDITSCRMNAVRVTKVLFLCSRNRRRSPTAERVFADRPGIETDSAGLAPDAELRVSLDQLEWADLVVVIPDRYDFMVTGVRQPEFTIACAARSR